MTDKESILSVSISEYILTFLRYVYVFSFLFSQGGQLVGLMPACSGSLPLDFVSVVSTHIALVLWSRWETATVSKAGLQLEAHVSGKEITVNSFGSYVVVSLFCLLCCNST